ncbi:MAG: hypothetical protein KDK91_05365 [Gammaproteobacteria bacterium]|nr:hypothetical protein [Gammaproteobacteria bacterium]
MLLAFSRADLAPQSFADSASWHPGHVSRLDLERGGQPLDTTRRCASCHEPQASYGHPVEFVPERPLPAGFPLSRDGRLTCLTCHAAPAQDGSTRPSPSRVASCSDCHAPAFFQAMADRGDSMDGLAHPVAAFALLDDQDGPDSVSTSCMSCHQSQAGAPSAARGPRSHSGGSLGQNHPVGTRYARHAEFGGYAAITQIPAEVRLPEGKVSCISCHRGYSARHGALVELRPGQGLCDACHRL